MPNNTTLPGTGESIRDIDKGGIKTQVMLLDIGGTGVESLATNSNPVPTVDRGADDLVGVALLEACIRGDLPLTVNPINAEKRDINGAQIHSDSPQVVGIVASTVGQQFLIDTQGYQTLSLTMGTMVAGITGSNDTRGTFGAISAFPIVLGAPVASAAANTNYVIPCLTRYIKLTVTTLGWAAYTLRYNAIPVNYLANAPVNLTQYLGAAASSTNPQHVTPVALAATNNQTIPAINVVTSTTPAATVVKATAGRLTMLNITNGSANPAYLHIYNAASVTLGTTASAHVYAVPAAAGSNIPIKLPDGGLYFSTGICYAFTGGIASTDNTALTAPSLVANLAYI
jgi:hypothetical protein